MDPKFRLEYGSYPFYENMLLYIWNDASYGIIFLKILYCNLSYEANLPFNTYIDIDFDHVSEKHSWGT